jgi:hypothetical protein
MSWSKILRTGSGTVRYALVIEGWPDIWVTDTSLTLTSETHGARGRNVRVGLQRKGLSFSERALLREGKLQASGMRVSIVSQDRQHHAAESFARVGREVGMLAADLETDDTEATLLSGWPLSSSYYHVGTEVIYTAGAEAPGQTTATITRGHWDTQPQSCYLHDGTDLLTHRVYYHPRSAEGRRATLYVWGQGDDATGYDPDGDEEDLGHPIWRGIVSVPPSLGDDMCTWTVALDHISSVFKQSIAARNKGIKPVGIYFSTSSPLSIAVAQYTSTGLRLRIAHNYVLFAANNNDLEEQINEILSDLRSDTQSGLSAFFASIRIGFNPASGAWVLDAYTVASPSAFFGGFCRMLIISSHVTGTIIAGADTWPAAGPWVRTANGEVVSISLVLPGFEGEEKYTATFPPTAGSTTTPGADVIQGLFGANRLDDFDRSGFGAPDAYEWRIGTDYSTTPSSADLEPWTPRRIWVDTNWSELSSNSITIAIDSLVPDPLRAREGSIDAEVIASGFDSDFDAYWIEVANSAETQKFYGWAQASTAIRPTYSAGGTTDVVGFINNVIESVEANANDGNLPFIRDTDFNTETSLIHRQPFVTASRYYRFAKAVALEDIIGEELKMGGWMWTVDRHTAKLTLVSIPILTPNLAATRDDDGDVIAVDRTNIQTPAGGAGRWPSFEIQSQGLVSSVSVKVGYVPADDDHTGTTYTFPDANLLSTHKRRGVGELVIAAKSRGLVGSAQTSAEIAANMLAILGREYVTIKVRVPFTLFGAMLGSVVLLTDARIPNPQGTRGVANERTLVIGRRWNLDPGSNEHGELELMMLLDRNAVAGYAPSGFLTDFTGATTVWTLELGSGSILNVLISPRGDGDVASTFAVGDAIVLVPLDDDDARVGGNTRAGTVTAVGVDTVSVTLGASWTPGGSGWMLEYGPAGDAQAAQLVSAYNAGEDGRVLDEPARSFS